MTKIMKQLLSLLTVFFVILSQFEVSVKAVETGTVGVEVSLEIDDTSGAIAADFDHIDRFNEYGIAIIVKDTYNDKNELVKRYGLINNSGEVVQEPIYNSITDFNDLYYLVTSKDENSIKEGIVSKQSGAVVLPVVYNFIPSLQENDLVMLYKVEDIAGTETWSNEIYSYNDGKFNPIEYPTGFDTDHLSNIWMEPIYPGVYRISSYNEYSTEIGTEFNSYQWILNSQGELLIDRMFTNIGDVLNKGGNSYFIADIFDRDSYVNQSGLFKLLPGENANIEVVLDPNDYNYTWFDQNSGLVNVSRVINGSWLNSQFDLVEGWLYGDNFGTSLNVFGFSGDSRLNLVSICRLVEFGYDCDNYLSRVFDTTNQNILNGKTYNFIYHANNQDYVYLIDSENKKSNVLIKNGDDFFLAFDEDVSGSIWINDQNIGITNNKIFNLNGLSNSISIFDERVLENVERNTVYDFESGLMLYGNVTDGFTHLIKLSSNETLIEDVFKLSINEATNGFITGTYKKNGINGTSYAFIFNISTGEFIYDLDMLSIGNFDESGYAQFIGQDTQTGLIYKDGSTLISSSEGLRGGLDAFEIYEDYGVKFAYDVSNKILYAFINGELVNRLYLSNFVVSKDAPMFIEGDFGQKYLTGNIELDTSKFDKIGSFVEGYAYVTIADEGIYRINRNFEYDLENLVLDVEDYVGSIVRKTDGSIVYSDWNEFGMVEIDLPYTLLSDIRQVGEFIYLVRVGTNEQQLLTYDPVTSQIEIFDNAAFGQNKRMKIRGITFIKDSVSYSGLINMEGRLLDFGDGVTYQFSRDNILRTNKDGSLNFINFDGETISDGSNVIYFRSLYERADGFYELQMMDGTYTVLYFKDSKIVNLGQVYFEYNLLSNRFYRFSKNCGESNGVGLIDIEGNVIIDPSECHTQLSINSDYELIEVFGRADGYSFDVSRGIYDFKGNLIPELSGYGARDFGLAVSSNGMLNVVKPMENVFRVESETMKYPAWTYNIFDLNTRTLVHPNDFMYQSQLINGKYYSFGKVERIELYDDLTEQEKQMVSGDRYENAEGQRIAIFTKDSYFNIENERLFDESKYEFVNFDGQVFTVGYYDEQTQSIKTRLLNDSGESLIGDHDSIEFDYELGWYITTDFKPFVDPNNPDEEMWFMVQQIVNSKSLQVMPYLFFRVDQNKLKQLGYTIIGINYGITSIEDLGTDRVIRYGILNKDGQFRVEPIYRSISEISKSGFAKTMKEKVETTCTVRTSNNTYSEVPCEVNRYGLLHIDRGVILEADFDLIESTNSYRNQWSTPNFDENGHLVIVEYIYDDQMKIVDRKVGLANENGPLFEGAVYQYAYYKNGYYYLKKFNENWKVVNGSDFEDVIEIVVPRVVEGATVNAIELSGDYVIATQRVYDETFDKIYDYVGVLNRNDMSLFMDFDYSSIKFEDGLFYLELYNTSLGTTQQAVMNEQKEFVVPFNNKYDSISEYVDGYAIGQSGTNEPEVTGANSVVNLLSTFFLDVNAADDDFVLEVIDEDGKVVGDLSEEYESATLLGTVDGVTKALVKKDGKYFIATLVEKPIVLIPITGVTLNTQTTTINVGETYNLIGTILPNDANEPVRVEWSSLNPDVASVDVNGVVKALKAGTTTVSYKVNSFEAVATIIVKSTITDNTPDQDTASTIIETIIQINPNLEKSEQNAVISDVEKLVGLLNGEQNINNKQLLQTMRNVFDLNPNFVSLLNEEEAVAFDQILNQLFEDAFTLDVTNKDIKHQIEGLLLALDILPLLEGYDLTIRLNISDVISKKDELVLTSYIQEKNYDDEYVYTLDIELIQVLNDLETMLSDLNRPVKLTFALPDRFVGIGELKVIRIHKGVVTELPVTLNPNYTFSFETDQFSSFTLVKASPVAVITDPEANSQTTNGGFNWMFGLVAIFIIVVGAVGALIYKRKAQA